MIGEEVRVEPSDLIEELRGTFLFEECTDEQLRWVAANSTVVEAPSGTVLFTPGAPDAFWVLLQGRMQLAHGQPGRESVVAEIDQPGAWSGWLPAFEAQPIGVGARTVRDSRLLRLEPEAVRHMIAAGFPITNHLMQGISGGARRITDHMAQREKLAALGKLAAGLAHELNNPAAAARRAASDLRLALWERDARALLLVHDLEEQQLVANLAFAREVVERPPLRLSPLEKSDREEEMAAWLEERGVSDGYTMAASFLDASITLDDLQGMEARLPAESLPDVFAWLEATTGADELAEQITVSVSRISDLVGAIKSYTFMDRAAELDIDLHTGIEDTLKILAYKVRKANIEVVKDFAPDLPPVTAQGSALNQVWTNLIVNAVEAMGEGGTLTIRTWREGDWALVEIADTGSGIPPEIMARLFEPFVSTKPVGSGTGLGLDIVRRSVADHGGAIRVESKPGDTRFQVRLPAAGTR